MYAILLTSRRHQETAPKLVEWLDENAREGLAVFELPASHRRRLRTINGLERVHKEIKRRTRVATLFPNEDALLRLVSTIRLRSSSPAQCGSMHTTME